MANPGDLRFPSIDGLRAFDAAARLGSFERAADELAVTASAVSKRVAAVEELLGGPLFTRSAKALALTASGREYLEQVRAALALLAAMPQHRRLAQGLQKLRVSAPPTFARQILVPELASFSAASPDIELEVVLSVPYLDGQAGGADIEVRHGDAAALGGRVLLHDRVLPMAAPLLVSRLPPLRLPVDLAHAPLLRTPIEPWSPWFRAAGLAWAEPASGPKLVDLGLTLEAAASGLGVALARPSLARQWLKSGGLQPLFDISACPAHLYCLLPHGADGAAARFADWLAACCERVATESQLLLEHARNSGAA
jgi:LysR family transcriptional regulator, glycine cleavage system transcriptional activator